MIKIENLIFKEDDEIKCFISKNFNFIYSKKDNTTCVWGETKDETPLYNPISPETITFKLNDKFEFNIDCILKLISIHPKKDECISCISNVIFDNVNLCINDDIKRLIKYVEKFNILCFLKIDFKTELTLKDVYKLKYLGISNVLINIFDNFNYNELINSINILSENNILVNCNFNLTSNNIEDVIKLFNSEKYNSLILSSLCFKKGKIKKTLLNDLIFIIKSKMFLNVFIKVPINSKTKYEIKTIKNDDGLFSCIIDFIENKIYCGNEFVNNFVNINDVNQIQDYWNSEQFNNVRKQLIKGF